MRKVFKARSRSVIDDESKKVPTSCSELICCCKCLHRKSLYGTTRFGEKIFYGYCCVVTAKHGGVVTVIRDHGSCKNYTCYYRPAPGIPVIIPDEDRPKAICLSGNYSCVDYYLDVEDCGLCLAKKYIDCPNREYLATKESGKKEGERQK